MIPTIKLSNTEEVQRILTRSASNFDDAINAVTPVLEAVKKDGDKAVCTYTKQFDNINISPKDIIYSDDEIKAAYDKLDADVIEALKTAQKNITAYCQEQKPNEWQRETSPGITVGQIVRPLDRVGCYIPGGSYPLPSTVMMTVTPAKVAGVTEIILATPPKEGNEAVLVAADIAGATKILKAGGAQAIAALAYGTESVAAVNKIVGPGNIYVAAAKQIVSTEVGIDFQAGPSEVLIYSDEGNAKYIASDLLAQAEHDKNAASVFVTANEELAKEVETEVTTQLADLPTKDIAEISLKDFGAIIIAENKEQAFAFINEYAPEHINIENEEQLALLNNAGSIFIGSFSPIAAGDYASGTNHVLPTAGAAKYIAGLSVLDFVKMPSTQTLSKEGLQNLSKTLTTLARIEGLEAHARSVEARKE